MKINLKGTYNNKINKAALCMAKIALNLILTENIKTKTTRQVA